MTSAYASKHLEVVTVSESLLQRSEPKFQLPVSSGLCKRYLTGLSPGSVWRCWRRENSMSILKK